MNKVYALYSSLLKKFGKQHWWPADSKYEVVVGALLTQNTNWRNVEKAIGNLKSAAVLEPELILGLEQRKLEELIRPSGFYRQKAERLKLLTKKYVEILERGSVPEREELLMVHGIGKETADSILLYAFGIPHFVIDAYARRFCSAYRLFESTRYDDYKSFFENSIPRRVSLYKEYHALIVRWGKS